MLMFNKSSLPSHSLRPPHICNYLPHTPPHPHPPRTPPSPPTSLDCQKLLQSHSYFPYIY